MGNLFFFLFFLNYLTSLLEVFIVSEEYLIIFSCLLPLGFSSMFLYKRWYRCFTALDSFSMDKGGVKRVQDLSSFEFQEQFDGCEPVCLLQSSSYGCHEKFFAVVLCMWAIL